MTDHEKYSVNFFRPGSDHAKGNKKLISILAIIWAVAVFGFHFLLIAVTTPTPEKTLTEFNEVWPQVQADAPSAASLQKFSRSLLLVLGKNIAVKENHKTILKNALSWSVLALQPDSAKAQFQNAPSAETIQLAAMSIGLQTAGLDKVMRDLLPSSLVAVKSPIISADTKQALPGIMNLYLTHNQSFLTDFNFIGFPFHYWYTAQFLLILFVVLCLIYAISLDKMNTKYEIVEET